MHTQPMKDSDGMTAVTDDMVLMTKLELTPAGLAALEEET